MTVNESNGIFSGATLTRWATAARSSEGFVGVGAVVLILSTLFFVLGVHGDTYAQKSHVPGAIGYLGALAAQLIVIALLTIAAVLYPGRRRWWRILAAVAVVLMLFFAGLPAVVAGYSWLTVLLLALATVVYDCIVVAYLAIVRPWAYLTGQPEA